MASTPRTTLKATARKTTVELTRQDIRTLILCTRRDRREIELALHTSDAMSERAGKPQSKFAELATLELAAIDIVLAKLEAL